MLGDEPNQRVRVVLQPAPREDENGISLTPDGATEAWTLSVIPLPPKDGQPASHGNGVDIAFEAPSRAAIDAFHAAAMAQGARDGFPPNDEPSPSKGQAMIDTPNDSPEEFARVIRADVVKWGKVVRDAGAKAD